MNPGCTALCNPRFSKVLNLVPSVSDGNGPMRAVVRPASIHADHSIVRTMQPNPIASRTTPLFVTVGVLGMAPATLASAPMVGRSAPTGESAPLTGTVAPGGPTSPAPARAPGGFGPEMLFLMLGLMVFMFAMTALSGRKEKRRRAELLSSIQRHDRVQTMGGIIGTVVEVHDDEIVLKVDEATNTRIRFTRQSVQQVLKKASESRSESSQPAAAGV